MKIVTAFALLIFINTFTLYSQSISDYNSIADSIIVRSLTERKAYERLHELCEIGPRLSGSGNLVKAVEWSRSRMESLGLKVWMQPVMVPHWERGGTEKAYMFSQGVHKELSIAALGGSVGTPDDGITAGVIEVSGLEELMQRKDEVKGKIVFFNRPLNPAYVNTFEAYEDAVGPRSSGANEAAKYGGIGVLIRSITSKYDNVPHVGAMRRYDSVYAKIPAAALGYQDADYLSNALKKNPSLKLTLQLSCAVLPDVQSYNVISEIKGSKYPDEVVIVGGHLDSWDKGTGAHDDGTGCMQALEVLDLFNRLGIKPSRTVRCILFANEENGVRGGTEYGKYADTTREKHVAAIESDRGGFTPRGFYFEIDSADRDRVISKAKQWLPVLQKAGIEWIREGHGGVDISKIKNADALIGFSPDEQRYFDVHHSDNDVFETVQPRELQLGAAAIAILAYMISENGL
jgi:hypothetical protein